MKTTVTEQRKADPGERRTTPGPVLRARGWVWEQTGAPKSLLVNTRRQVVRSRSSDLLITLGLVCDQFELRDITAC